MASTQKATLMGCPNEGGSLTKMLCSVSRVTILGDSPVRKAVQLAGKDQNQREPTPKRLLTG